MNESEWLSSNDPAQMMAFIEDFRPSMMADRWVRKKELLSAQLPSQPRDLARWFRGVKKFDFYPNALPSYAALLREVLGNPFRHVYYDPLWGIRNQGAVIRIASRAYDEQDWSSLAILADALEEAGCTNAEILNHLRGLERVPGDWLKCRGCGKVYRHIHKYSDCDSPGCDGEDYDEVEKWTPLQGPHVRGCWALDILLGRS